MNYLSNWYWKPAVKFKIIKYTKCRSMDWIAPKCINWSQITTRAMKCHSVQHFDFLMKSLNAFKGKKIYNLYYSMMDYSPNGIPNQTMNLGKRNMEDFNENHWKNAVGMDFYIDIDAPIGALDEAFKCSVRVANYLDSMNFPYYWRFSGNGFHFVTPWAYFFSCGWSLNPDSDKEINVYSRYREIAKYIFDRFTEMVDLSIYDERRVLKIPYTLAVYSRFVMVCAPCNRNFDEADYEFNEDSERLLAKEDILYNASGNVNNLLGDMAIFCLSKKKKRKIKGGVDGKDKVKESEKGKKEGNQ